MESFNSLKLWLFSTISIRRKVAPLVDAINLKLIVSPGMATTVSTVSINAIFTPSEGSSTSPSEQAAINDTIINAWNPFFNIFIFIIWSGIIKVFALLRNYVPIRLWEWGNTVGRHSQNSGSYLLIFGGFLRYISRRDRI